MDEALPPAPEADYADFTHWLRPTDGGATELIDPETHESLRDTPAVVRERFGEGLDFLQEHGSRIAVTIAYFGHRTGSDLDAPGDPSWFEREVAASDVLIHEGDAMSRHVLDAAQQHPRNASDVAERPSDLRICLAALDSHVPLLASELEPDDPSRLGVMLDEMGYFLLDRELNSKYEAGTTPLAQQMVFHVLREHAMVGQIGLGLKHLAAQIPALAARLQSAEGLHLVMTVGAAHRDLTRKLAAYNIAVQEKVLSESHDPLIAVARTGVIEPSQERMWRLRQAREAAERAQAHS